MVCLAADGNLSQIQFKKIPDTHDSPLMALSQHSTIFLSSPNQQCWFLQLRLESADSPAGPNAKDEIEMFVVSILPSQGPPIEY